MCISCRDVNSNLYLLMSKNTIGHNWTHLWMCLLGNCFYAFHIFWRSRGFYSLVHITLSFQVFLANEMVWDLFNCSPGVIVFLLVHLPKAALCKRTGGVCHLCPVVIVAVKTDQVNFYFFFKTVNYNDFRMRMSLLSCEGK